MKDILCIEDLYDEQEFFWTFFFSSCYPNGYLEEKDIGCTGPHWDLHKITWSKLKNLLRNTRKLEWAFFLMLPMVVIEQNEIEESLKTMRQYLDTLPFEKEDYEMITMCIVENIVSEP